VEPFGWHCDEAWTVVQTLARSLQEKSVVIIDTHQHVFWLNKDDLGLIAEMDQLGIDVAWLLTWILPPGENDWTYHRCTSPCHAREDGSHGAIPLRDIVQTRQRFPGRFVAGYCPPPALPSAPELFEAAYHIHGVRVCGEFSYRIPLDDPRCIQLFRKVGEWKCPVVLHIDPAYLPGPDGKPVFCERWNGDSLDALERTIQACPQTVFIGHAPGFWRFISGDGHQDPARVPQGPNVPGGHVVRLMRQYPTLWADLSAGSGLKTIRRDLGFTREFLHEFSDRLLFGRDDYGDNLRQFLQSLALPQELLDKILFRNALNLVALPDAGVGPT
jgi:predicted TIM-barrel fold metal-dependent hydrolase